MKTRWKVLVVVLAVVLVGIVLWGALFKPDVTLSAARKQALYDSAASKDVVIYFNSGGWGNTPIEQATDFTPVLYGIRDTLAQQGYNTAVIPFVRTASGLSGKIGDIKDFLVSFEYSGEALANEVEYLSVTFPGKKVVIIGLSNGGALTEKTMQDVEKDTSVYAVVAGVPKWYQGYSSDRILILNNNGRDQYSAGNIGALAVALIKAPFKWLHAKFERRPLNFSRSIEIPGHEYPWTSADVGPPVTDFIKSRFTPRVP